MQKCERMHFIGINHTINTNALYIMFKQYEVQFFNKKNQIYPEYPCLYGFIVYKFFLNV
jgi:hypothetical protein